MPASSEPSAFWGLYCRSTLAKTMLTLSERPSSLSECVTLVMITSLILMTRNSCWPLPALRCVIVASLRCTPVAHACISTGDALSMLCVKERSWKLALPSPPPLPPRISPAFDTPHDQLRTSISPLCLSSSDSPLMSPIFAKMSDAITGLLSYRSAAGMLRPTRAANATSGAWGPKHEQAAESRNCSGGHVKLQQANVIVQTVVAE